MLTARNINTPVQLLDSALIQRINTTTINKPNGKGREGLVGGHERPEEQPEDMLKDINGTADGSARCPPRPTLATPPKPQQLPLSMATYTGVAQSTPSARPRPEGGARVEIDSLPGQDQIEPSRDNASVEGPALPGINQDTSNMGEAPRPVMPAAVTNGPPPPAGPPAMTADRPPSGQDQVMPPPAPRPSQTGRPARGSGLVDSVGAPGPPSSSQPGPGLPGPPRPLAPTAPSAPSASTGPTGPPPLGPLPASGPLGPAAAAPPPPRPPPPPPLATTSSSSSRSSTSTLATTTTLSITKSQETSISVSSDSLLLSLVTSFVTITRSEQGKEKLPPTLAPPSIDHATTTATPQAIAVAQSISVVVSSTSAIAAVTSTSTEAANDKDGSTLHPTMRTLLIVFVILGVLSVVVAIIIFMMIKSHRQRRVRQQNIRSQCSSDAPSDHIGVAVTTHVTVAPHDNPFLTASEKAIIDTASSDGASERNLKKSSSFSDAVNSFVEKSRSLAYKISP